MVSTDPSALPLFVGLELSEGLRLGEREGLKLGDEVAVSEGERLGVGEAVVDGEGL
jgi:hypothetical protein